MADVNLQLVREFFELNWFRVLTNWRHDPVRHRSYEHAPQLFVESTVSPDRTINLPQVLSAEDLSAIERAVVEVRAWHGDRFWPSVVEANPVLSQFAQEASLTVARDVFSDRPFSTILVVSELPASPGHRARSVDLVIEAGVDHVLEFSSVLGDLLEKVSPTANYAASQTLQTLRLVKRYRFIRNQQLEFAFATEPPTSSDDAPPDTTDSYVETGDLIDDLEFDDEVF